MRRRPAKGCAKIQPPDPQAALLPYQAAWVKDESAIKLMEKARQIGLSWTAAYAAVERTARQGARYDQWVSSRDETQARLFVSDCLFWCNTLKAPVTDLGEVLIDPDSKATAHTLKLASGRCIYSMSSNPDAQAGKRGSRLLDEFALHPDPKKLYAIAEPGLTWGGTLEILSTHRGSQNFFNTLVREVREGGNPKNLSLHRVTLEDALAQGFLYRLQQTLPAADPRQAMDEAAYFEYVKSRAPDEETFLQEYLCQPADDQAAFLEYDLIASAEYPANMPWQTVENGPLTAGIDIGRHHDLTVLWVLEKLGDVFYTRHIECLKNLSKSAQENILWPWIAQCQRTCIDASGLGIGWVDDATDRFGTKVEGVTFTSSVKESLAYPVRGMLEDRRLRLPYDPAIRADLRSLRKTVTSAGNVRFEAERTPHGHADRFWALALALHANSNTPGPIDYIPGNPRPTAELMRGAHWSTAMEHY